jgi:hypothetical protein
LVAAAVFFQGQEITADQVEAEQEPTLAVLRHQVKEIMAALEAEVASILVAAAVVDLVALEQQVLDLLVVMVVLVQLILRVQA